MNVVETENAMMAVLAERVQQDKKWGEQNHNPAVWLTILVEEIGEFAKAALHSRQEDDETGTLHEEAIHIAAVGLAIVECLDRSKWYWPDEEVVAQMEEE